MSNQIAQLIRRVAQLEDRINNMIRQGKVSAINQQTGEIKLKTGDFESNWLTWSEQAGGAFTRSMPVEGQAVSGFFPGGNAEYGFAVPGHDTESNPLPGAAEGEHIYEKGDLLESRTADGYTIIVGGTRYAFTAQGLEVDGGHILSNGKHVDDHHKHTGVEAGGDTSGPPE